MLLCGLDTCIPQERRHPVDGNPRKQQFDGKCNSETVGMATWNSGTHNELLETPLPVTCHTLRFGMARPKEILGSRQNDFERIQYEFGKWAIHRHFLPEVAAVQMEVS
jgi:hypothetical protein